MNEFFTTWYTIYNAFADLDRWITPPLKLIIPMEPSLLSTVFIFFWKVHAGLFGFFSPCGRKAWDQKEDIMHKFTICKTVCLMSDNEFKGNVIRVLWIKQSFSEHWVLPLVLVKHVLCFRRGWKLWKMTDCSALAASRLWLGQSGEVFPSLHQELSLYNGTNV